MGIMARRRQALQKKQTETKKIILKKSDKVGTNSEKKEEAKDVNSKRKS